MPGRSLLLLFTLMLAGAIGGGAWWNAQARGSGAVRRAAPPRPAQKIVYGADACAATKVAMANRVPRNSFSVASGNFDATFYHLNLNLDMVDDSIAGVVR